MTKRIRNIIDRELIVRTNNHTYHQEYGVVGATSNVYVEGGVTVLQTQYKIDEVSFVTINGVTQAYERDYNILDNFHIEFNGVVLDTRTISIGYFYDPLSSETARTPPQLLYFYGDRSSGGEGLIKFLFEIEAHDGRNFYWEITKDGNDKPAQNSSGQALTGTTTSVSGISGGKLIEYNLTEAEVIGNNDKDITFTLIVVYDLTNEFGKNEKLLEAFKFTMKEEASELVMSIDPDEVITQPVDDKIHTINYRVIKGTTQVLAWELYDNLGNVLDHGNETNLPNTSMNVIHDFTYNDPSIIYTLAVTEHGITHSISSTIEVNIDARKAEIGWWAHSRLGELTDSIAFSNATKTSSHDYFQTKNVVRPDVGSTSVAVLISDPVVISDEGTGGLSGKHIIVKVPKDWGPVEFKYGHYTAVFNIAYQGAGADPLTEPFVWYAHADPITPLDLEENLSIKRI